MNEDTYTPPTDLFPDIDDPFQNVFSPDSRGADHAFASQDAYENDFVDAPESPSPSRYFPATEFAASAVPERQWLTPDLIPEKTVTILSGDGGTGKSLLAHQLAIAVATGGRWLGRSVKRGAAIFYSAEDDKDELHRRTNDILRASNKSFRDLSDLTICSLAGEDALLANDTPKGLVPTALFTDLEAKASEIGAVFVVIDTLADVFPSNENDRTKARQFIGITRGLAIRQRCAVLLLSHPSLSGMSSGSGMSGSTAWNNSVRSRLYLERVKDEGHEPNPDRRMLTTKKANYARTGAGIGITWQDGVFEADPTETCLDRMAGAAKAERIFLKLLREFDAEGRKVRHSTGDGYAPHAFVSSGRAEGLSKAALKGAMESLFRNGIIRVIEEGPPSRRHKRIVEASK